MNLASVVGPHPPDSTALRAESGRAVTYGELRDDVARLRGGFAGLGVRRGDRVALALPNGPDVVATYLAVLGLGAVAVPLNPTSPVPELQRDLVATGARALVAGPVAARTASALDRAATPALAHVVGTDDPADPDQPHDLDGLAALRAAEPVPLVDVEPDDLAVLVFTSGTAGPSRPAMLSHANLLANIDQLLASGARQTPADRVLDVLPPFHIYGLNVVIGLSLAAGSTLVPVERFDPRATLDRLVAEGVTVVPGVPTMWSAWADLDGVAPDAFAGVRLASSGAAPFDPAVRAALRERFGLQVVEGYGLTEASPAVTSGLGVDAPDGSIGVPLPGVTVRLVERSGNSGRAAGDGRGVQGADRVDGTAGVDGSGGVDDVLVGDPGEVWVRGPNVFAGYWDDPEATAAALAPGGWLRTGDVAVVDDDGHLFLVDRAKDIVIVSGFNVFPAEVEEVLTLHPAVAEAAVVGRPDPRTGEAVTARVVTARGVARPTSEEVVAFCHEHLAGYKCPVEVVFVDELPHSLSGKLLRRSLR